MESDAENTNDEETVDFEQLLASGLSLSALEALKAHLSDTSVISLKSETIDQPEPIPEREPTQNLQAELLNSDSNSKFKLKEYWEKRFEGEEQYDWLATYDDISSALVPFIDFNDRILVLGCGNSTFSASLYDAGYQNIVNIDYSEVVIQNMSEKHSSLRPKMQWEFMDMTDITFSAESFDKVIDKAAMDALMVDEEDVWNPQRAVIDSVDKMCMSVSKVLKPGGKYIQISFAQPHFRTKYLTGDRATNTISNLYSADHGYSCRYNWTLIPHIVIEKEIGCINCFAYVMTKN